MSIEGILSRSLGGTAPHTVHELCEIAPPELITNLAHAIDRRVYVATKEHDEKVALAMQSYMESQRESMRLRVMGWIEA